MRQKNIALAFGAAVLLGCGGGGGAAPPAVDVTGDWNVRSEWEGFWSGWDVVTLTMEEDGTVSGTYLGGSVTGSVSGYNVNLTVDSPDPIYINATLNTAGTASTSGTWHDSSGSGLFEAVKL